MDVRGNHIRVQSMGPRHKPFDLSIAPPREVNADFCSVHRLFETEDTLDNISFPEVTKYPQIEKMFYWEDNEDVIERIGLGKVTALNKQSED